MFKVQTKKECHFFSNINPKQAEVTSNKYTHTGSELHGCLHSPISVAFTEAGKASNLFGDISSEGDVLAFIEFIAQYQNIATGRTSSVESPNALRSKTVARIPGSIQMNHTKRSSK